MGLSSFLPHASPASQLVSATSLWCLPGLFLTGGLSPLILGPRAQGTAVQGQGTTPSVSSAPWSRTAPCPTQCPSFPLASRRAMWSSWDYKLHRQDLWIKCGLFCLKILLLGADIQAPGKKQCYSGSDWKAQREVKRSWSREERIEIASGGPALAVLLSGSVPHLLVCMRRWDRRSKVPPLQASLHSPADLPWKSLQQ